MVKSLGDDPDPERRILKPAKSLMTRRLGVGDDLTFTTLMGDQS